MKTVDVLSLFYRPERWSVDHREEHHRAELVKDEVPVAARSRLMARRC